MSKSKTIRRLTVRDIQKHKNNTPMVCLTAYTTPMAQILDEHVDLLLVGDSLGMVIYGMDSTLGVTMEMMIEHGKAVMRGTKHAFITIDMPFGSYEESPEQAFRNAARIMQETGCSGVKLEGGAEMAETIEFLNKRGIPVMAHIGLMPQSVNTLSGYGTRGRGEDEGERIMQDAIAVTDAGAFACVIEGTAEPVAKLITETINIPTIGIGASVACDGQILVTDDAMGLFRDFKPKFVKQYAQLGDIVSSAVSEYSDEVRNRQFPSEQHVVGTTKITTKKEACYD